MDRDYATNRILAIQWNPNAFGEEMSDVVDFHIYVRIDDSETYTYLGRTASGDATYFEWKLNSVVLFNEFLKYPQFRHTYQFRVYALTAETHFRPVDTAGPVDYQPAVTVTDDMTTTQDLSGGEDLDTVADQSLVIRWTRDPAVMNLSDLKEFHVYVRIDSAGNYIYLGSTRSPFTTSLEWKRNAAGLSSLCKEGPQFGHTYEFKVFALTLSQTPRSFGPFTPMGSLQYNLGE